MARITPPTGPPHDALGQVVLFQAADGQVSLDVRLEADTVWLSQAQMAELFGRERSVITRHVGNVFGRGRLPSQAMCISCTLLVQTTASCASTETG